MHCVPSLKPQPCTGHVGQPFHRMLLPKLWLRQLPTGLPYSWEEGPQKKYRHSMVEHYLSLYQCPPFRCLASCRLWYLLLLKLDYSRQLPTQQAGTYKQTV